MSPSLAASTTADPRVTLRVLRAMLISDRRRIDGILLPFLEFEVVVSSFAFAFVVVGEAEVAVEEVVGAVDGNEAFTLIVAGLWLLPW